MHWSDPEFEEIQKQSEDGLRAVLVKIAVEIAVAAVVGAVIITVLIMFRILP